MSDVEWCQNCGDVVTDDGCACAAIPKPTGALTRLVIRRDIGHGFIEDPNGQFVRYAEAQHVITQQAQELERLEGVCKERLEQGQQLHDQLRQLHDQLAAAQARCREMEREIETLTTCSCEGCDDNLEESAFCFPCMNKVQQQVTQLQATLAAREAQP